MENAPVIRITTYRWLHPGYVERYTKWATEAYYPLALKTGLVSRYDRYTIVKESPEYNRTLTISHWKSVSAQDNLYNRPEGAAVVKDIEATWASHREVTWSAVYQLMRGFENAPADSKEDKKTTPEIMPVIHLEGYRLSAEAEERYINWLTRWGYEAYIPLLMKLPGLKKYDCYKLIDYVMPEGYRVKDYGIHPRYLSILTFDNVKAFEDYEKSLERAVFKAGIDGHFPRGLDFKWYVTYQLTKSFTK